jgi:hypothetical protein
MLAAWRASMGDVERRLALRVPVHGFAVCYGDALPVCGRIENISRSGALLDIAGTPSGAMLELELKVGTGTARVTARPVRIEQGARRTKLALQFADLSPMDREVLDAAIDEAAAVVARRPVLVLDGDISRRRTLVAQLAERGMTPLAPHTPLDAIDLLTNSQLPVSVALIAPSFGHSLEALQQLVADSFPWVRAATISDDVEATAHHALRLLPALA